MAKQKNNYPPSEKARMHTDIYRARQKGIRIDTKSRTIYITSTDQMNEQHIMRLRTRYRFIIQMAIDESKDLKVYISGPIDSENIETGQRWDIEAQKKHFAKVEHTLRAQGYRPVNPFKNGLPEGTHWRKHMRRDIQMLSKCDMIYMLHGWEYSKGCRLELDVATTFGMMVRYEERR